MRKLFAILMALCLTLTLCVCAFATEEPVQSPTDEPVYSVEFISYDTDTPNQTFYTVPEGETLGITAPVSEESDFIGFTIEGEYEIISGSLDSPDLVIRPLTDVVIIAHYKDSGSEPTTPEGDNGENSPQTGDSQLIFVMGAVFVVALAGIAVAAVKLRGKKEEN